MKKLLSALLVCVMCFSMVACGIDSMDLLNDIESILDILNDLNLDEYGDDIGGDPDEPYKIPIILLHGRASNSENFFGVRTKIDIDTNSYYGVDQEVLFTSPENHKILSIEEGGLGEYLEEELGYKPNKNLFAFNYPNVDMVEMNAKRLAQYINNLVDAASKGETGTANFVDPSRLFATEEDRANKQVKFILIGHSMGGLVSRYYIENLGTDHVEKLITICTPHYGSGLGQASDFFDLPFEPCDVDLQTDSMLFGGEKQTNFSFPGSEEEYAYLNQSHPLRGNHDTDIPYYAIGGYDVNTEEDVINDRLNREVEALSAVMLRDLRNGRVFSVGFDINAENREAFDQCINDKVNELSLAEYGEPSLLRFSGDGGDDIVNYMSQFGVRFNMQGQNTGHQRIEHATLIITTGYSLVNHYHSGIAAEPLMHEAVKKYIGADAEPKTDWTDYTAVNFDTDHWTMVNAKYDESQNYIILTEDDKKWQNGSIWYNTPVPENFVLEMDYYTGNTEGRYGGADGIVVAFYADKDSKRQSGLDIGFSGCRGYGIELDTYYNTERQDPLNVNHIALVKENVRNHIVANELPEAEDEQWHHLKVVVENGVCEAFVDGISKISAPVTPTGHRWLGITSSTGEGDNLHAVKNISLMHN